MMSTAWIEFRKWPYEDDLLHVAVAAGDDGYSAVQDFYVSPTEIASLGTQLQAFPQDLKDEVSFNLGQREDFSAYAVMLRFWIYDSAGHAAVTIDVANNRRQPHTRNGCFTIRCEVASINQLGKNLTVWAENDEESTRSELTPV